MSKHPKLAPDKAVDGLILGVPEDVFRYYHNAALRIELEFRDKRAARIARENGGKIAPDDLSTVALRC